MAFIYDLDNEYGGKIISDAGSPGPALVVEGGVAGQNSLQVKKTTVGSPTIAPLHIAHTSVASGAVLSFGGGFISAASILGIGATGAALGFDYVLPVSLNGVMRGIPMMSLTSITTAAAF